MGQWPSDLGQKHWVEVNSGLFKTKAKNAQEENEDSALDK